MPNKKVAVIGSGGREHAICWKLCQSSNVEKIYAMPGSDCFSQMEKVECVPGISVLDLNSICEWTEKSKIDLVVVGPEDPLANGLADRLSSVGIRCFGPSQSGAQIESNKKWAKEFMTRHKIPTARFKAFTDAKEAKDFLKSASFDALVVKASGLAAGKGVVVANDINEAETAIDEILTEKKFGGAGQEIVVEEKLEGEEISVLAFVDSNTVRVMLPAQDHKRLRDNDQGPNTGGMGAYCPCPLISEQEMKIVERDVLQKAIDGLRSEGIKYCGVLYAGIMLTSNGPQVLEFNCRFGDPETQVILPLLKTDLFEIMLACCKDTLDKVKTEWSTNMYAVGVVMASAKYPESSTKGCRISELPTNSDDMVIFHSGTKLDSNGHFVTNGGRVLTVVRLAPDLKCAAAQATKVCEKISFSDFSAQFRRDIAKKAFGFFTLSYKDSGVDIDAGDDLVQRIKPLARGTFRKGVIGGIGGFGGLLRLKELGYENPVLCEVTKGVKAKVIMAIECKSYENIGYDLVTVCANDVLESGSEPVAFLDYMACGKLQVTVAAQIIKGISEACRESNCALLGGETAEMPSVYKIGEYDLAGYCLGVLDHGNELPRFDDYKDGDIILGIPSNGFHCSGLDIVAKIMEKLHINENTKLDFIENTLGHEILKPSRSYVKCLLPLIRSGIIKSVAHVSSGLLDAIKKLLPNNYSVELDTRNIPIPKLQAWFGFKGEFASETLLKYFNCGIGILFVISKENMNNIPINDLVYVTEIKSKTGKTTVTVNNFQDKIKNYAKEFSMEIPLTQRLYDSDVNVLLNNEINATIKSSLRPEVYSTKANKLLTRIPHGYEDPILVIGTDGVGTKIKIAQSTKCHETIGIDLVAMCVNDILCNGAEPLSFLGYGVCGKLSQDVNHIVKSMSIGCEQAQCSLVDVEFSELPGLYEANNYDIAGFALGIVERNHMLPKVSDITAGDVIIGLPSNGVHSNGFSLVHKVMNVAKVNFNMMTPFGKTFGEELLVPTQIYVKAILPLLKAKLIKAVAHITGGGLLENIPRVLPPELQVELDSRTFNIPPIFAWLSEKGNISSSEMLRTYNCGVGLVLVVAPELKTQVMEQLEIQYKAFECGHVMKRETEHSPQVRVTHIEKCFQLVKKSLARPKKRIGVLISGSGSNLQAIIDATKDSTWYMGAEVVLVISNKSDAFGLQRAAKENIPSVVISHRDFSSREDFDDAMDDALERHNVDIVCLAGFMRILSSKFVKKWKGRLLNIHPSLLPKYPGLGVQQKALHAGESESGCTIHFVDDGVDTGAIVKQTRVPILMTDDCESLTERIHTAEHYAYPIAIKNVSMDMVKLGELGKVVWIS